MDSTSGARMRMKRVCLLVDDTDKLLLITGFQPKQIQALQIQEDYLRMDKKPKPLTRVLQPNTMKRRMALGTLGKLKRNFTNV